jgi:hypothetical protein
MLETQPLGYPQISSEPQIVMLFFGTSFAASIVSSASVPGFPGDEYDWLDLAHHSKRDQRNKYQ